MTVQVLVGDCLASLRTLPDGAAQCCVTSPPYYGLRDYGHAGQIGLEPTPDEYIARMVEVFREVRRVLRDDGTLWLNVGDSYAGPKASGGAEKAGFNARYFGRPAQVTDKQAETAATKPAFRTPDGYKPKDLLMIPAMLALALRADGWFLRSDIIWHKPNPMPESVRDRPTSAHEHVFLLTKSARYFYDAEAVAEPVSENTAWTYAQPDKAARAGVTTNGTGKSTMRTRPDDNTRNARNVWTIATQPYSGAHFATMPPDLAERCIKAGTSEKGQCPHCLTPWGRVIDLESRPNAPSCNGKYDGINKHRTVSGGVSNDARARVDRGWSPSCDCPEHAPVPQTVLDPFGGAGTTGLVADRLGRGAILCELNPEYARLARERITADAPLLAGVA